MKKLEQIQVARAIAALMVVYYHSYMALRAFDDAAAVPLPFLAQSGYLGVNLFFIISGFIIGVVTDVPEFRPREFFLKRVFRIFPVFWIFFGAQLLLARTEHTIFTRLPTSPTELTHHAALLPLAGEPVYAVAWSLEHELVFYLLALLLVPFARPVGLFCTVLALGVLGRFVDVGWDYHFLSAHQLEFAAGLGLCLLRKRLPRLGVALPALVAAGGYALTVHQLVPHAGILAGSALLVALLNLSDVFVMTRLSFLARIGDASYSLYLCHWLLTGAAASFAWRLGLPGWCAEPYRAALILACVLFSLIVYRYLEAPVIRFGRWLADGKRPDELIASEPSRQKIVPAGALVALALFVVTFAGLTVLGREQYAASQTTAVNAGSAAAAALLDDVSTARDGERLVSAVAWGTVSVRNAAGMRVVDLERVPKTTCIDALVRAGSVPGLVAASGSTRQADERRVPISEQDARTVCRRTHDNAMRFMFREQAAGLR